VPYPQDDKSERQRLVKSADRNRLQRLSVDEIILTIPLESHFASREEVICDPMRLLAASSHRRQTCGPRDREGRAT
jgi:hypothetical protein